MARGAPGAPEAKGRGRGGLTSGWSLKRLSRKRPRLNSISKAEPLATVTRLRWFRENMLAAGRAGPSSAPPAPPPLRLVASASVPRRPPSGPAGEAPRPVPKLRPRTRYLGRAGRGPLSFHPRQRPVRWSRFRGALATLAQPLCRNPGPTARLPADPAPLAHGGGAQPLPAGVPDATPGRGEGPEQPRPPAAPTWAPDNLRTENPGPTWVARGALHLWPDLTGKPLPNRHSRLPTVPKSPSLSPSSVRLPPN